MKEELPNIISKFRGKGTCSLNKNSTSQFKFFLAWLLLFLGITETFAGPRDFMQAQKIAQQKAATLGASISELNIQQARARSRGEVTPQQTTPYYIFNFNDSTGYAIVGGDDRMPAIVGYSDKGTLNPDSLPVNLKSFLAAYKATVESVEKGDTAAVKNVKAAMKRKAGSYTPIAPLLGGIEWSQNAPFNNLCPKYEGEDRSITGCTATAMAQIMRYWKWPSTLQNDIPGYKWRGLQLETIPKGFVYDWENMLDTIYLYGRYTDAQATAVAALMLHTGISIGSMYTADGTAALEGNVPDALTTYFGYDNQTICYLYRKDFEWDDWNKILQKELFLKRPIFYGGRNENNTTGHVFICDGIDSDGYYHINWGWQSDNGYFDITILNPAYDKSHKDEFQNDGFCYNNTAIIGIQPADGQEHEPAFSFDRLYVSYSGVSFDETYRKNSTDPFYGSYISESIHPKTTFNTPTIWLAIGEKDENGNFVKISEKSTKINTQNMPSAVSVNIPICHAFTKGTHRLVLIQSTDDEKTWQACYGNGRQVEVYVTEHEIFDKYSRYKEMEAEGLNFQVDRMEHYASVINGNNLENVVIPEFVNCDGVDYPVQFISSRCFAKCDKIESIFIPKTVESLGRIIDDISYFYEGCFEGCTNLREVIFEKGTKLKTIGGYCFQGCKSLKSIEVPDGVEILSAKAFANCSSLTSVSLPNTLKKIDGHCFYRCSSLTNIVIPEGVSEIPQQCFEECTSLVNVELPKTASKIGVQCFYGCSSLTNIVIPEGVSEIPKQCFRECPSLVSVVLPSSLREIGSDCFLDCSSLNNVTIKEGILKISENCFNRCSSLENIVLPGSIKEIGSDCFLDCSSLTNVTIKEGISKISERCFRRCSSLTNICLPSTVKELGAYCFAGCSSLTRVNLSKSMEIGTGCFYSCANLTDVVMFEGVRKLGNDCFKDCSSLTSINLPSTLCEIGACCFYGCQKLQSEIVIPEGVVELPDSCFYECDALKKITLPSTLKTMGEYSLYFCRSLTEILLPESVREIGNSCFANCWALTNIVIPEGVKKLPEDCFWYCDRIESFTLPSTMQEIEDSCFFQCVPKKIYLKAKEVPVNFSSSFDYEDWFVKKRKEQTVLYVPEESLAEYKKECGSLFKDILPLKSTGIDDVEMSNLKISSNGENLLFSGLQDGTKIHLYSLDGKCIGEDVARNGTVSFSTSEPMVIAKIGNKSIKIATNKTL